MYLMYVFMGKAFYRGVKGQVLNTFFLFVYFGLTHLLFLLLFFIYFFIIIIFFYACVQSTKAVRMMSLSHTQSPSSNMLHEKKCQMF